VGSLGCVDPKVNGTCTLHWAAFTNDGVSTLNGPKPYLIGLLPDCCLKLIPFSTELS
jgi:hypothetical protein